MTDRMKDVLGSGAIILELEVMIILARMILGG